VVRRGTGHVHRDAREQLSSTPPVGETRLPASLPIGGSPGIGDFGNHRSGEGSLRDRNSFISEVACRSGFA
jgi:hypothetical protein